MKYYGAKIWNLKPLISKVFKRERRNSFELLVLIFLCLYFQIIQAFLFQFKSGDLNNACILLVYNLPKIISYYLNYFLKTPNFSNSYQANYYCISGFVS